MTPACYAINSDDMRGIVDQVERTGGSPFNLDYIRAHIDAANSDTVLVEVKTMEEMREYLN